MQQHKRRRKGGLIHYPVLILFSLFFVGKIGRASCRERV